MPLPKPYKNESRDHFVRRFMTDQNAVTEFPNNQVRYAVADDHFDRNLPSNPFKYYWDNDTAAIWYNKQHILNIKKHPDGYIIIYSKLSQISSGQTFKLLFDIEKAAGNIDDIASNNVSKRNKPSDEP